MPLQHVRRLSEGLLPRWSTSPKKDKQKAKEEVASDEQQLGVGGAGRPWTPTPPPKGVGDRTGTSRPPLSSTTAPERGTKSRASTMKSAASTSRSPSKVPLPPSPAKTPLQPRRSDIASLAPGYTPLAGPSTSYRPETPQQFDDSMLTFRSPGSTSGFSLPGTKSFLGRRKSVNSTSSFGGSSFRSLGTFASRRKSNVGGGGEENGLLSPGRRRVREDLTWRMLREELEGHLGEGQVIERCLTEVDFDDGEECQALKELWDERVVRRALASRQANEPLI